MADDIRQNMGFDAAQALQTLERLNKAFDSFGSHVDSLAEKLAKFNVGSRATETATTKLASAFNANIGASEQSVARLTTSMQLMSRIVFTQFVIRQLRILRTTFQETAEQAAAFQRKIAEISTIAPGATQGQLARSVREISDNLNIPLLDTASGVYQALSNNIGGVAESLQLTESAARFAKATNSSLADSVDLLSGTINAFGLSVNDAERLSGIFFKAIETGRVTATELANSLGRVQGRAAALGVSIEETAAALAVVTTSGINSSEAITQLSGVLTALTKPTAAMTAALAKLGFESSEAAIAALGLPELLKRIGASTDGTSASLAKLFPNVRGIAGQLNLTNQNLATFADLITNAKNASDGFANSKFLQATATDAERITKEINKLHNALTVDLGQGLLKAAADTAQFVGGADNVIGAVKILSPLVLSASAALLGYAASSRAAATASALLATRLGPVGVALAVLGAASSAGLAIDSAFFSGALDGFKELERASKKSLDDFKATESEKVAAADRANEERVRLALQNVADLNRIYLKDRDNARAANDALVQNTKDSVRDIVGVREKLVDELARQSDDARKFSSDSQFRLADIQTGQNDRRFEQDTSRLSDSQQVFALTQRAAQQARAASRAFIAAAQAGDERGLQRALAAFDIAQTTNERAAEVAKTTQSIGLQHRALQQMQQLEQQRIKNEKQLQRLTQDRVAALDKERDKQQAIVDRTRAAGKLLLDNLNQFDGDKLLPQDQLLERQANRQKALAELQNVALSSKDLDVAKVLGLADFVSRFESELKRDPITLALNVQDETARIQAQLTQSFDKFSVKVGFDISALEQAIGRTFKTPDEVSQGIIEARKRANEIQEQLSQQSTSDKSIALIRNQLAEIETVADRVQNSLRGDRSNVGKGFRAFLTDFKAVSAASEVTQDDLQRLFKQLDSVKENAQGFFGIGKRPFLLGDLEVIVQALPKLKQLQEQRTKIIEVPPGTIEQFNQIKGVLETIDPVTPFKSAASAIGQGATSAERIAVSFERAAAAAGRLGIQPSISAQSPRRVEAVTQQLGSTSTVNVGGITVNAAPGANGQVIAQEVASVLNRSARRGSIQLRVV